MLFTWQQDEASLRKAIANMRRKLQKSGELIEDEVSDDSADFSFSSVCNNHKLLWWLQDDDDEDEDDDDDMVP